MKNAALKFEPGAVDVHRVAAESSQRGARIGTVVALEEGGVVRVDFPGNPQGPSVARLALSGAEAERLGMRWTDAKVLIVFADDDVRQPVITGIVRDSLEDSFSELAEWEGFPQLSLRAQDELVLQCGDARITLHRDGRITIVGKEILSRAQQRNRIRGATVDIN